MIKQVIVIRKDLNMRKGKMCAQAAHASMKVILDRMSEYTEEANVFYLDTTTEMKQWLNGTFTKIVVGCKDYPELMLIEEKAIEAGLPTAAVIDRGFTEFDGEPKLTCIAIGPAKEEEIDKITGHLQLL